jgi:dUTP pyrophosphatase
MKQPTLRIMKIDENAITPVYAREGDAGLDIFSNIDYTLKAGTRSTIPTGICFGLDKGYVALVWDKSGVAGKSGIKTMAGVIDSGYRGEVKVVLLNTSTEDYPIKKGDKIAQVLIQKVNSAIIKEVDSLEETKRGEGGFGSTGLKQK